MQYWQLYHKFFAQRPQKKWSSPMFFFCKEVSFGRKECSFDNPVEQFFSTPKIYREKSKITRKILKKNFFWKLRCPEKVTLDTSNAILTTLNFFILKIDFSSYALVLFWYFSLLKRLENRTNIRFLNRHAIL